MKISPNTEKLIQIDRESRQTASDIAIAITAKQLDAAKQQGNAAVQLIQQAVIASPNNTQRGVDIRA